MPAAIEGISLITRYLLRVFPQVERELAALFHRAASIPDERLRKQALDSLMKNFTAWAAVFIPFILPV